MKMRTEFLSVLSPTKNKSTNGQFVPYLKLYSLLPR